MDLAVVIVSYNVKTLLRDCLSWLLRSLRDSPALQAQVWVIDNASTDGSADMVRDEFPQVRLVASQENLGFAGGNNLALQALGFLTQSGPDQPQQPRPRHVLLLNPDTVVLDEAPAKLVRFLDRHPSAGACGPRLVYPDGRFQHAAFRFPNLPQIFLDLFPPPGRLSQPILNSALNGRYSRRLYENRQPFPVDFVLGAAMLVRATAIQQVGLLDEGYFMYCEEMDLQRRLQAAGWSIACVPTALVIHHAGASTSQFQGAMQVALWRSRLKYFRRYHGYVFNRLTSGLVRLAATLQARQALRQAPPDLAERLAACQAITALATGNGLLSESSSPEWS